MRTNKMVKVTLVLLLAAILTSGAVSGTFAKYASESTGSDTARVAKWDVKLNGAAWSDTVNFNLFSYTDTNVDVNGVNDDAKVIAPGTEGSFSFTIKNDSEVTAKYSIELTETNANNIPIEYKVGDGEWQVPNEGKITLATDKNLTFGSAAETVTVAWRWAFEGSESTNFKTSQTTDTDNVLGAAGTATVTVAATITAEQVN